MEECTALCSADSAWAALTEVPHAATLTRACYSDWPLLLAVSQSSYWTMSILMDGDVHYYRVPVVPALHPQSPVDFYTLIHLGAMNAVARTSWHFNTLAGGRGRNSWSGRSLEERSGISYTTVYFLIHTAWLWLVLIIIVWRWLEYNPGSYVRSLFWSEKHAKTGQPGNKSTLASIKSI